MFITSDVGVLFIQIGCFSFQEGSTYIGTSDAVTSQDIGQSKILIFIVIFSTVLVCFQYFNIGQIVIQHALISPMHRNCCGTSIIQCMNNLSFILSVLN